MSFTFYNPNNKRPKNVQFLPELSTSSSKKSQISSYQTSYCSLNVTSNPLLNKTNNSNITIIDKDRYYSFLENESKKILSKYKISYDQIRIKKRTFSRKKTKLKTLKEIFPSVEKKTFVKKSNKIKRGSILEILLDNNKQILNNSSKEKKKKNLNKILHNIEIKKKLNEENVLEEKNKILKLPKEYYEIDKELNNNIKNIFIKNRNLKLDYKKEYIQLNTIYIERFLKKCIKEEKFQSEKKNYRKIFVILDSTVIFTESFIKGKFIDVPFNNYINKLNEKQREKIYGNFLKDCRNKFNKNLLKFLYNKNGKIILDLKDINDNEKYIFASFTPYFHGIHLFNETNKIFEIENAKNYSNENDLFLDESFNENSIELNFNYNRNYKKKINKIKYLNDSSFTDGINYFTKEEFEYFSEDENKKKLNNYKFLSSILSNNLKKYTNYLFNKNKTEKQSFINSRPNENTKNGLIKLISIYNKNIQKKSLYKIKVNPYYFKDKINNSNKIRIETEKFYGLNPFQEFLKRNLKNLSSSQFQSDYLTEKNFPYVASFNLPLLMKHFPKLKRKEIFSVYVDYKTLLKFYISLNKDYDKIEKGIDFDTFFNCNPSMKYQGKILAKKIFHGLNNNKKFLNFEEFLKGLVTMKFDTIENKLDLFMRIIDADHNGKMAFEEVFELSKISLERFFKNKDSNKEEEKEQNYIIFELADYFAKLIFDIMDIDLNKEIEIDSIKRKIMLNQLNEKKFNEGILASEYLEMFVCSDMF
jgi:hypothetical protein